MAQSDFHSSSVVKRTVSPQSVADGATVNGAAVDAKGFRWASLSIIAGTLGAAATVKVQGADTEGGSYADIAGATVTLAATDDDTVKMGVLDAHQMPRFLRAVVTNGGGGTALVSASFVLYGCANSEEYIDRTAGGVDELGFLVLTT